MTAELRSINCTNCGAGLEVIGGGRVITKVCGYCGASLDANENFRVLEVFGEMPRPDSPFRIGMTGEIQGVTFTVIGTLGQFEEWRGQRWSWVDHQLYSPTHGYAWLTVEDGHTLLTRKVRDWPSGTFLTSQIVELSERPPSRGWRGTTHHYFATSFWETDFVEGEFNWRPARKAKGITVSMMPRSETRQMIQYVQNVRNGRPTDEREVEVTTYWPEAATSFGVAPLTPKGVHALQPYTPDPMQKVAKFWFLGLTGAAVSLALMVSAMAPPSRTLYKGPPNEVPAALTFEIEDAERVARVRFHQRLDNAFSAYSVTLIGPEETLLAEMFREISYYSGGSGEDSWSEGSRTSSIDFQPKATGTHRLEVALAEGNTSPNLTISVDQGLRSPIWLWLAAPVLFLFFLWQTTARMRHNKARWSGGDWEDEE